MADDRIYIKCNVCGETLYLGKQFGAEPFYWENYGNGDKNSPSLEDRLNAFYEKHVHLLEGSKRFYGDYSIEYETDL